MTKTHLYAWIISIWLLGFLSVAEAETPDTASDLTLHFFRDMALEKNFDILQAREHVKAQYGVYLQVRANSLPRIQGLVDGSRIDARRLDFFDQRNDWHADIKVTQTVWTSGKNSALKKREKFIEHAATHALHITVQDVLFQVAKRYFDILLAQAKLRVQTQFTDLLKEELVSEKHKLEAGIVSQFNVLRADVALANSYEPLIRAKHEVSLAMEELFLVTGHTRKDKDEANYQPLADTLTYTPITVVFQEALERAKQTRSEIARLKALIEAENESLGATRADYWPKIETFYRYGAENALASATWKHRLKGGQYGFSAHWNIFDFQHTAGRMQQTRSLKKIAEIRLKEQYHVIEIEVRKAIFKLREARELVEASRKVVEQAEESLRLAKSRFDTGSATQLDVLDSQLSLTQARTNEIQALYDYNVAVAHLHRVLNT